MSPQPNSSPGRHQASEPAPEDALLSLARTCEAAGFGQQAQCILTACTLLASGYRELVSDPVDDMLSRAHGYAVAGACESAVIALMPSNATFTGGRMADGTVIAQVVLGQDGAAHSREARWLSMAWLAALLRALSRQIEARGGSAGAAR